jgi:hypothetical protein
MVVISLRVDQFVRGYMQAFIDMLSPSGTAQAEQTGRGCAEPSALTLSRLKSPSTSA